MKVKVGESRFGEGLVWKSWSFGFVEIQYFFKSKEVELWIGRWKVIG